MNYRTLLSRHRDALMGVAAVLVVLFHGEWKTAPFPLGLISREGQIGVDLFVFLAGFGLAHSLVRRPALADYWTRRLRRLLPAYYVWLCVMLVAAAGFILLKRPAGFFPRWLILHLLPVGIWINNLPQVWYVSAALGYYAIAPLAFALMERARFPRALTGVLMLLTGILLPAVSGMNDAEIALMRVPALMLGLAVGLADIQADARLRSGLAWLVLLAAIGLCLPYAKSLPLINDLGRKRLHRLVLDCVAPALAVALAFGFEGLTRTPARFLNHMFEALGSVSLEIYLSHTLLSGLVRDVLHWPSPLVLCALLAAAYPMARVMAWLAARLLALWQRVGGALRKA